MIDFMEWVKDITDIEDTPLIDEIIDVLEQVQPSN